MSMSISDPGSGIEFAGGKGMSGFVARPRQLMSRDYLTMLGAVRRFHGVATRFLQETDDLDATTYGEFIERHRFPGPFVELYAVPLVACVWSSGRADALTYPARYLFRFLDHHGMLTVADRRGWIGHLCRSGRGPDRHCASRRGSHAGGPRRGARASERQPRWGAGPRRGRAGDACRSGSSPAR